MTNTLEHKTEERLKMYRVSPEVYKAMLELTNAASQDVDPDLHELIKIRASQLNGCAFCLDMHTHDARKRGVSEQKLTLVSVWEDTGDLFSEQEQAALALTEEITELTGRGHVSDAVYNRAAAAFSERELSQVIAAVMTINAWNRIGVATRLSPPRR